MPGDSATPPALVTETLARVAIKRGRQNRDDLLAPVPAAGPDCPPSARPRAVAHQPPASLQPPLQFQRPRLAAADFLDLGLREEKLFAVFPSVEVTVASVVVVPARGV